MALGCMVWSKRGKHHGDGFCMVIPVENGDPVGSRLRENDKGESGNDIVERRYHATNLETPSETRNSAWSSP
jgi:hypothetical protein